MKKPIEIKLYKDCIPRKGVWYDHLGTIFISVMRKSKPYVRRKSIDSDNKRDNELSEWHRIWQYDRIEAKYGVEKYGIKSYERTIKVDNENHRIDSVVEKLAIEFQHTLSVGIEEMNTRFKAHSKFGLLPYLVIDLTNYSLASSEILLNLNHRNSLKTKYEKWSKCDYALSNNLFLDLKDGIIRFVNTIENGSYTIEKDFFLNNLLELEVELSEKIKINELLVKRELLKEKRKLRIIESEELNRKALLENQIEKTKIKEEQIRKKKIEKEKERYYHKKRDDVEFKYYRKCFTNPIIKPYVKLYDEEVFEYSSLSEIEDGLIYKTHWYISDSSEINIEYTTVTEITKEEIPTYRGSEIRTKYNYLYSTIKVKNKNISIVEFEWYKGRNVKKVDKTEYTLF